MNTRKSITRYFTSSLLAVIFVMIAAREAYSQINPDGAIHIADREWRWQSAPNLSGSRNRSAAASLGNHLYVFGGNYVNYYSVTYYTSSFDGLSWQEIPGFLSFEDGIPQIPPACDRYGLAGARLGSDIYAIGGRNSDVTIWQTVSRFDGDEWSDVANLPSPRFDLSAATLNDAIYAFGGNSGSGVQTNVFRYDGSSWSEVSGLPQPRQGHAAATLDGAIYSIGGFDSGTYHTNVYRFDGASWTEVAGLPSPRAYLGAVALHNAIYAIGGSDASGATTNVFRFDGSAWSEVVGLDEPLTYIAAADFNNSIYAMSGITAKRLTVERGVDPACGDAAGGFVVTIDGMSLGNGSDITEVTLCGIPATIESQSETQVVVTAGASGFSMRNGEVRVVSASLGETTHANAFSYIASGPHHGGNSLLVKSPFPIGSGSDITNVIMGEIEISVIEQENDQFSILVPSGLTWGQADIIVDSTTMGRTSMLNAYNINPRGGIGENWLAWGDDIGLPEPRTLHGLEVYNDKLYVIGGSDGSSQSSVYMFNGTSWSAGAPIPQPRYGLGVANYQDALYAIGGYNGGAQSDVYRYDGLSWSSISALPQPRYSLGVSVYNNAIYSVGGSDGGEKADVYFFAGDNWLSAPSLPEARSAVSVVSLGDYMYSIGGFVGGSGGGARQQVYRFDGELWVEVNSLPAPRYQMASSVLDTDIYVVGGTEFVSDVGFVYHDTVYRFDGEHWSSVVQLPEARSGARAQTYRGAIYVVGGRVYNGGPISTNVYRYPAKAGTGTGVNPISGSAVGGYTVELTGTYLGNGSDVTNVTLCGVPVMQIVSQSPTQIVVIAASASGPGTGDVRVFSTSYGELVKADAFTYDYAPTITVHAEGNGAVAPGGEIMVEYGGSTNFLIQADAHHHIVSIATNGTHVADSPFPRNALSTKELAWHDIVADGTLAVEFALNQYSLVYSSGAGGHVSEPSAQMIGHGFDGAPVTALSDDGALFDRWSDGQVESERTDTNVTTDLSVSAHFKSSRGIPIDWYAERVLMPEGEQTWADVENEDSDEDGYMNWQEFIADTCPTNPASVIPQLTLNFMVGGDVLSVDPTSTGRIYYVDIKTNIVDVDWHMVTNSYGTGYSWSYQIPLYNTGPMYYRGRISLP